ncbi:MAG: hypothetical protein GX364_05065 [Firmicutes bacterium]|nr:hypothetical protein [Bacillota bacterium]
MIRSTPLFMPTVQAQNAHTIFPFPLQRFFFGLTPPKSVTFSHLFTLLQDVTTLLHGYCLRFCLFPGKYVAQYCPPMATPTIDNVSD